MRPVRSFDVGDFVAVLRNGEVFEAKILMYAFTTRKTVYKIHYSGYNKRHDAWVPERHILPLNEDTRRRINYENIRRSASKGALGAGRSQCEPEAAREATEEEKRPAT